MGKSNCSLNSGQKNVNEKPIKVCPLTFEINHMSMFPHRDGGFSLEIGHEFPPVPHLPRPEFFSSSPTTLESALYQKYNLQESLQIFIHTFLNYDFISDILSPISSLI